MTRGFIYDIGTHTLMRPAYVSNYEFPVAAFTTDNDWGRLENSLMTEAA